MTLAVQTNAQLAPTSADFQRDVDEARDKATILDGIVKAQNLYTLIGDGKHLKVEGWQTIAKGYGMSIHVTSVRKLDGGGYEAKAVVRNYKKLEHLLINGVPLEAAQYASEEGDGEAECGTKGDNNWVNKPWFQQRSMAQTRAISKAGRAALSWVVILAGYSPTPAEEMLRDEVFNNERKQQQQQRPAPPVIIDDSLPAMLQICPEHEVPFIQRDGQHGEFFVHGDRDNQCKATGVVADLFAKAVEAAGMSKEDARPWVKETFGETWGKLTIRQKVEAIELLAPTEETEDNIEYEDLDESPVILDGDTVAAEARA